jgi:hypothetical protein
MKLRYCLLALAAAITSISNISATNAQTQFQESKHAQCQRFEAGLIQFNQNLSTYKPDETSQRKIMLNTLNILSTEMKRLKREQYQDVKLQALHQQLLKNITSGHDKLAAHIRATEGSAQAEDVYSGLQSLPYQISEVSGQFEQHCGKADSAKSPQAFVPEGWHIEKEVSGDLNGDRKADRVIQIAEPGGKADSPRFDQQRSLIVLLATEKGWQKIASAPKLLFCRGCAGMLGTDNGEYIRLELKNRVLTVRQLAGSREAVQMTHRFWIDHGSQKFVCIGEDVNSYDRANGNEIRDSQNFLTGKRIVQEYRGRSGTKELIRTQYLQVPRQPQSIESIDIEQVRRSAPSLPSS